MISNGNKMDEVKRAFNGINVFKGQYVSIATCDSEGNPNVAPIGSMRVVDENTVHVLRGFLPKTLNNLNDNPRVAFAVCKKSSLIGDLLMFAKDQPKVFGYRLYCEYTGIEKSQEVVNRESAAIANRVPFFIKPFFLRFCRKNLTSLLKFRIISIREIV